MLPRLLETYLLFGQKVLKLRCDAKDMDNEAENAAILTRKRCSLVTLVNNKDSKVEAEAKGGVVFIACDFSNYLKLIQITKLEMMRPGTFAVVSVPASLSILCESQRLFVSMMVWVWTMLKPLGYLLGTMRCRQQERDKRCEHSQWGRQSLKEQDWTLFRDSLLLIGFRLVDQRMVDEKTRLCEFVFQKKAT